MPRIIDNENERKNINVQIRISKNEKEKLDSVCKALNLTYTEFFLTSIDNLSSYLQKTIKSEN
jgi:antitoxin component of RelBE/YafQ-DinJ toxin-antitoxin module